MFYLLEEGLVLILSLLNENENSKLSPEARSMFWSRVDTSSCFGFIYLLPERGVRGKVEN